jgi:hypothetical protein
MVTGNGGSGGYIDWLDMGHFSHYGFATMSPNTGHYSGSAEGSWALNNSEAIIDWGYRTIHESTVLSKKIDLSLTIMIVDLATTTSQLAPTVIARARKRCLPTLTIMTGASMALLLGR